MKNKRAGGPGIKSGAPLLITITLVIVLYIIVLPPTERAALLDSPSVSGFNDPDTGSSLTNGGTDASLTTEHDEFVFSGPGRIDVASRGEFDHDIPTVHLTTTQDAQVLFAENPFVIQNNMFGRTGHTATFSVDDPDLISDMLLTFEAAKHNGLLTMTLNGHQIFSDYTDSPIIGPIPVSSGMLMKLNILKFEVNSPGWAFWSTHKYAIKNFKIQGDVIDVSRQGSMSTFSLRADEVNSLQDVELSFVPQCVQREIGKVKGYINGNLIFNQVPDCGIKNIHHTEKSYLMVGPNKIEFSSEMGDVLLDTIEVTTTIDEEANDVTFFFELDRDLFNFQIEEEHVCGEIDGFCPDRCNEDIDKDCCFEEFTNAFWCDMPTQNSDDKCVGHVTPSTVFRCRSGYEDVNGNPPDEGEDICGDDTDNECPVGCSRFFDKDCCLEDDSERFWCDDVPVSGLIDVCKEEMDADSCRLCPDGYEGEDQDPSCNFESKNPIKDEVEIKSTFEVVAKFLFVDDDRNKEAEIIVNGFTTNFDTYKDKFDKDISDFVKDGSNYITIRPQSDFSLVEVRIDVDKQ